MGYHRTFCDDSKTVNVNTVAKRLVFPRILFVALLSGVSSALRRLMAAAISIAGKYTSVEGVSNAADD